MQIASTQQPKKRNSLAEWIKKQYPTVYFVQETHLTQTQIHTLKIQGGNIIFLAKRKSQNNCGSYSVGRQYKFQSKNNENR